MLSTIQIAETKNYNFNNKFQQKERKNRMMITDILVNFPLIYDCTIIKILKIETMR